MTHKQNHKNKKRKKNRNIPAFYCKQKERHKLIINNGERKN